MKHFLGVMMVLMTLPPATAQMQDWRMDASASRLEFIATFEKAEAPGVFREFDTHLRFDPDKPAGSRLQVSVRVTSADMNSADINNAIRGPEWFDFSRFPQAEFRSSDIRRIAPNRYVARGTLVLKGMQQAVEVPFTWRASRDAPVMEGETTLTRSRFGIGLGEWKATDVIGAEVKVRFRLRLRKGG